MAKIYEMSKVLLRDLLIFIKNPNDQQIEIPFREKVKILSTLLILEIIFTVLIIRPLIIYIDKLVKLKSDTDFYLEFTLIETIIVLVIIVPFIEEILFRYVLRYKRITKKIIQGEKWNRLFPYLVYTSTIGFGFIHVSNYQNNDLDFYLFSFFLILSQLLGGFIIAFIRIRINFKWGVYYHMAWNFIFAIVFPLIMHLIKNPFIEKTDQYTITITEKVFFDNNQKKIYTIDSSKNRIKKIDINQYSLQKVLDTLYQKDKYYVDDVLVNLKYSSQKGLTKEEFLKILLKEYDIQRNNNQ